MKFINLYLTLLLLIAIIIAPSCSLNTITFNKSKVKTNVKMMTTTQMRTYLRTQMEEISGYYHVQNFNDQKDPILYLTNSQRYSTFQYITVSEELIRFTASKNKTKQVLSKI